jgi:hypothetical protein
MLFAHLRASDGFRLQAMQLHDEKYDARCDHQIRVHHVHAMYAMQRVTMGLG